MNYIKPILHLLLLVSINQIALANEHGHQVVKTDLYQVSHGKVDAATFIGWSMYHNACVNCHGVGGVGSDMAPDLTEIADRLSPEQFRLKVMHNTIVRFTGDDWRNMEQALFEEIAKQEKRDSGELETMPRWKHNPAVTANIKNIYRYLKARADGAIGTEKPGILKK
ncbi:MAG: mono/diheme cytochrome c family protein [Gammaproteobacteria bacterium]|jgi:mono/diheme cytochrome c family protein